MSNAMCMSLSLLSVKKAMKLGSSTVPSGLCQQSCLKCMQNIATENNAKNEVVKIWDLDRPLNAFYVLF